MHRAPGMWGVPRPGQVLGLLLLENDPAGCPGVTRDRVTMPSGQEQER